MFASAPTTKQYESLPGHTLRSPWQYQTSIHCSYREIPGQAPRLLRTQVPCNQNWGRSAWLSAIDFRERAHYEAPAAQHWPADYVPIIGDLKPIGSMTTQPQGTAEFTF